MKRLSLWCSATILALALVPLTGCDSGGDQDRDRDHVINVDGEGYTDFDLTALDAWLTTVPNEPLSDAEAAAILFAREEEKMDRDAFRVFDAAYTPDAFTKIAESEQTHMAAVGLLVDKYGLVDPVTDDATGAFTDPDVLALYQSFLAQGDDSVTAALAAGAGTQEMTIMDLAAGLEATDNRDVECVFLNLQKGSRNHLRRLVDLLGSRDVTYVPAYLSPEAFDAIIDGAMEQGTSC